MVGIKMHFGSIPWFLSALIGIENWSRESWIEMHVASLYWNNQTTKKASANKNAILVFAFQTSQHFTYFKWTFAVDLFSGVIGCH